MKKIYVTQLHADDVGKRVRITLNHESAVEDTIQEIVHTKAGNQTTTLVRLNAIQPPHQFGYVGDRAGFFRFNSLQRVEIEG